MQWLFKRAETTWVHMKNGKPHRWIILATSSTVHLVHVGANCLIEKRSNLKKIDEGFENAASLSLLIHSFNFHLRLRTLAIMIPSKTIDDIVIMRFELFHPCPDTSQWLGIETARFLRCRWFRDVPSCNSWSTRYGKDWSAHFSGSFEMSVAFDLYSILVLGFIQSASDLIPSLVVQLVLVTFNLKLVTPFAACIFAPLPPSEVGGGGVRRRARN